MSRALHPIRAFSPILLALALLCSGTVRAGTGGPDAGGWMWADSREPGVDTSYETPATWTTITTGWADEEVFPVDLALSFTLYGVTSSRVWLSSNGWLSFVDPGAVTGPDNTSLPDVLRPNALLAFHWDDLDGSVSSFARHGATTNGHLIQLRLTHKASGELVQLNIQFYDDGSVKVVYVLAPILASATIGIENELGTVGTELVYDGNLAAGVDITADSAILFYPLAGPDCSASTPLVCPGSASGTTLTGVNDTSTYGCATGSWDGRESIHTFTLTDVSDVDLTLSGIGTRAAALFVLSESCDNQLNCIAGGVANVSLPLLPVGTYHVVVDGRTAGDDGPYDLAASCTSASTPIACGGSFDGAAVGVSRIDAWSCRTGDFSGPEQLLTFSIGSTKSVTARLSPSDPYDLLIVEQDDLVGSSASCIAGHDDNLSLRLGAGDYVIAVDGPAGATGPFTVELECTDPVVPLEPGMLVATCDTFWFGQPTGSPYVLGTIDVRDPGCDPDAVLGENWWPPMYHNEMPNPTGDPRDEWTDVNLGHIFGLALDDQPRPNIYVTASSMYGRGGSGLIHRIDGTSGAISIFADLPNQVAASGRPPGLGNIAFDKRRQQFFVTNHEDGQIYRLDINGVVLDTYDPFAPDDGSSGFAPLGERLWGIGVHEDRVYFAVWAEDIFRPSATAANSIWSIAIDATGALDPGDLVEEIVVDPLDASQASMPVSDIAFSKDGLMFIAERSMLSDDEPNAHQSRILEFEGGHLAWLPSSNVYQLGEYGTGINAAGGVDYDCNEPDACNIGPRVWATGDALRLTATEAIYGVQGLPATGGLVADSYLIDLDGDILEQDKSSLGDVEVFRICDVCLPPTADATWSGGPCVGDVVTLDASGSTCDLPDVAYRWLQGVAVVPGCDWSTSPLCDVTPSGPTVYTLEVECGDIDGCTSQIQVPVTVDPEPVPALSVPAAVCAGDEIVLDASATDPNGCPSGLDYQFWEGANLLRPWGPSSTHGPLAPAASTSYTVEVRCGDCQVGETSPVDVVPLPVAAAGPDVSACELQPVTLDGSSSTDPGCPGGLLYEWRQGATVVRPAASDPTWSPPTTPPGTTSYTLVVSCAGPPGCEAADVIVVEIRSCPLAVTYGAYGAVRQAGGAVVVSWSTLVEDGTLGFVVERGPSSSGPFEVVGDHEARGAGHRYALELADSTAAAWLRIVEVTASGRGDATPVFRSETPDGGRRARTRRRGDVQRSR